MHPLILYDIARQRQAELRAEAARHRASAAARRTYRHTPSTSSTWARLRTALRGRTDTQPVTSPSPTSPQDAELTERMATDGPAGVDIQLRRFVRHARRRNVDPLLLDILTDQSQPDVARQRAYGRIVTELGRDRRSPSVTTSNEHDAA